MYRFSQVTVCSSSTPPLVRLGNNRLVDCMHPCLLLRVLAEYDLQLCAGSTGTPASLYSCTPSEGIHAQVTSQREEGREGRGGREGEREGKRPIDHVKTPPGLAGARSHAAGCPSCEEERKRQRERETDAAGYRTFMAAAYGCTMLGSHSPKAQTRYCRGL